MGYYGKCCKQAGNFPKKKSVHIARATDDVFYDEDGNIWERVPAHMLSIAKGKKYFLVEFGIGKELDSHQ